MCVCVGCCQARRSLFSLLAVYPQWNPLPLAELPWKMAVDASLPDKTCGAVVWRRPPLRAAGSLSKTCSAARLLPPRSFVFAPFADPLLSIKTFSVAFLHRARRPARGERRCGSFFPTWCGGSGAVRNSYRRDLSAPGSPLFAAAWVWGPAGGLGLRVPDRIRALGCGVLLEVIAFSFL